MPLFGCIGRVFRDASGRAVRLFAAGRLVDEPRNDRHRIALRYEAASGCGTMPHRVAVGYRITLRCQLFRGNKEVHSETSNVNEAWRGALYRR